jgi:hypothetical protein
MRGVWHDPAKAEGARSMKQSERLHAIMLAAGAIRKLPLSAELRSWLISKIRR